MFGKINTKSILLLIRQLYNCFLTQDETSDILKILISCMLVMYMLLSVTNVLISLFIELDNAYLCLNW